MHLCYACKSEIEVDIDIPISRRDECPTCLVDVRCCKNCQFHDRGYHNQCTEPTADFVRDREKGNFCGHFRMRVATESDGDNSELVGAKAKLDALFKNLE